MIRTATAADAAAIARVHVAGWRAAYKDLLPAEFLAGLSVEQRQRGWTDALTQPAPDEHVFVLDDDGVRGFVSVGRSRDADATAETGELVAIYLDPACWRRGLGTRLQRRGLDALAADGFRRAILWVLDGNERARAFYERTGWVADRHSKTEVRGAVTLREVRYSRPLPLA